MDTFCKFYTINSQIHGNFIKSISKFRGITVRHIIGMLMRHTFPSVAIFSLLEIPQILWNDNEEDLNLFSDGGQVFHMLSNRLWYGMLSHMFGFLAI